MEISEKLKEELGKVELELLVSLAKFHQRGIGLGEECYIGTVFRPQKEEDKIAAECLFLKGYLGKPKKSHFVYRLGLFKKNLGDVWVENVYQLINKTIDSLELTPL